MHFNRLRFLKFEDKLKRLKIIIQRYVVPVDDTIDFYCGKFPLTPLIADRLDNGNIMFWSAMLSLFSYFVWVILY